MEKISKKMIEDLKKEDLKWVPFEKMLAKHLKDKKFHQAYTEEMVRLNIAHQVRELRTAKKMTQKIIAQKAGTLQSVIARIESGKRGISVDTLGRVARALGKEIQLV